MKRCFMYSNAVFLIVPNDKNVQSTRIVLCLDLKKKKKMHTNILMKQENTHIFFNKSKIWKIFIKCKFGNIMISEKCGFVCYV